MTQLSFPWNGSTVGDAGPYSDSEFSDVLDRLVAWDGTNANYGVVRGALNEYQVLQTSVASAQIRVQSGAAMVQGKWSYNDGDLNFTIAANSSGNPRIDAVVLQVSYTAQTVRLAVKQGTPAVSPSIPALTQSAGVFWEIYLARVAVASGFVTITQANITDMRTWVNLPNAEGVNVTNNSGSILEKGSVVIPDTPVTGVIRVNTSAVTVMPNPPFGIMETRTSASGGLGRAIRSGVTPVICDGAVSLGDRLFTSTSSAGQATTTTPFDPNNICFGYVITANAGAGTACLAYVDFGAYFKLAEPVNFLAYRNGNQAVGGAGTAKVQLNAEDADRGGYFDSTVNYRFTPLIAGMYFFYGCVSPDASNIRAIIYKNGAAVSRGINAGATEMSVCSIILDMNGSTDYVELFYNASGACNIVGTTAPFKTFLQGYLLTRK